MTNNHFPHFFLAANSAGGFYSAFNNNYSVADWSAYIIKGGPGTGKSGVMKKFLKRATELKKQVVLCPCSSDPKSLDAVILPDDKIIILDGTAPHVVEPTLPGVCEQIINTGNFWNRKILLKNKNDIIKISADNKFLHKRAAEYIKAVGQLLGCNFNLQLKSTNIDKAISYGAKLAERYIAKTDGTPQEWVRFLGGITPEGYVFYDQTIDILSSEKVVICDEIGAVASVIFSGIRDYALNCGHEIITVKNPILPNDITDAIILPKLKLAFCRQSNFSNITANSRKIHTRRFLISQELNNSREKIKFNNKAALTIINAAVKTLKDAKSAHDVLESFYINAMDFNALEEYSQGVIENIFNT